VSRSDALGDDSIRQCLIFYSEHGKSLGSGEIIGRTSTGLTITNEKMVRVIGLAALDPSSRTKCAGHCATP